MSSSTLSNVTRFFSQPTQASVYHCLSPVGISRCTDDCDPSCLKLAFSGFCHCPEVIVFVATTFAYDIEGTLCCDCFCRAAIVPWLSSPHWILSFVLCSFYLDWFPSLTGLILFWFIYIFFSFECVTPAPLMWTFYVPRLLFSERKMPFKFQLINEAFNFEWGAKIYIH